MAIHNDKMFVFGGHTIAGHDGKDISNDIFFLNLKTMMWQKVQVSSKNMVHPLAYSASTVLLDKH